MSSPRKRIRKQKLETLQLLDGVLYKQNGMPVSVRPEDRHYRDAFRNMQQRVFSFGRWAPDGLYTFDGRVMRPMARG